MTDPRIEAAAKALYEREGRVEPWEDAHKENPALPEEYYGDAIAALAAADKAATITTFTGAEVNKAGWVCGACEPGDYDKCDDCQSACDDVAQFVNRLLGGTE